MQVPPRMHAVAFHQHGGPEVLQYVEMPTPVPAEGETLVRVRACGIEPGLDVRTRRDGATWPLELPHVLGASIAGEVAVADASPGAPAVGARVAVIAAMVCGACHDCVSGHDNSCGSQRLIGAHRPGGYAEYVAVPTINLVALSPQVSFEQAAAVPISYGVAWQMLVARGRVEPTDTVLVIGAAGGVGVAAVQIARLRGATVVALASGAAKLEALTAIGADATVDAAGGSESVEERVMAVTGGRGVDVVVETVGPATWASSLAVLRREGRLVCCGASSGFEVGLDLRQMYRRNLSLFFCAGGTRHAVRTVFDLVNSGKLSPVVHAAYPLADAVVAHQALAERRHVGKLVLVP